MKAVSTKGQLFLGVAFINDCGGAAAIVMAVITPIVLGGLAYGGEVAY